MKFCNLIILLIMNFQNSKLQEWRKFQRFGYKAKSDTFKACHAVPRKPVPSKQGLIVGIGNNNSVEHQCKVGINLTGNKLYSSAKSLWPPVTMRLLCKQTASQAGYSTAGAPLHHLLSEENAEKDKKLKCHSVITWGSQLGGAFISLESTGFLNRKYRPPCWSPLL